MNTAMRTTLVCAVCAAAAAMPGCGKGSSAGKHGNYYNKAAKVWMNFPDDWKVKDGFMDQVVTAISPQEDATASFAMDSEARMTSEEYMAANVAEMKNRMTEFKEMARSACEVGGRQAQRLTYSFAVGKEKFQAAAWFLVDGKKRYAITCKAPPDAFDGYRQQFEDVAGSFFIE
jgi:hypothetical protein